MNAFLVMQQGAPQPGWALQNTPDFKPAGARTYEPKAMVTDTTATNIELLLRFYRLTGETKFLARIPEAIAWLESLALPPGVAPQGRTHPTFIEVGTNKALYVHREGSNIFNGRYYVNADPKGTIGHYSSFRRIDTARLRKLYEEAKALSPAQAAADSPLTPGAGIVPLPRFYVEDAGRAPSVETLVGSLNALGYWLVPLGTNSHWYSGDGLTTIPDGDDSQTMVGDASDTSLILTTGSWHFDGDVHPQHGCADTCAR